MGLPLEHVGYWLRLRDHPDAGYSTPRHVGTTSYYAASETVDTTWKGARGGTSGLVEMAREAQTTPIPPPPPPAPPAAAPRIVVATAMPGPEALLEHATHGLRDLLRRGRLPFEVQGPTTRALNAAQELRPLLGRSGPDLAAMLLTVSYVTTRAIEEYRNTACLSEAAQMIAQRDALLAIANSNPIDAVIAEQAAAQSRTWSTR